MDNPNYLKILGSNVLLNRKRSHLSQAELAARSFMDINYIGEIERGEANPTIKILRKISRSLKINIAELADGF